jgi:hypothetical protein
MPAEADDDDRAKEVQLYKDLYRRLGSPRPGPWARMAQEHWKEFLPEYARHLKSRGLWSLVTLIAQEEALNRFAELVENGFDPHGAKEIALKEFILLDPPEETTPEEIEEGEGNQIEAFLRMLSAPENPPPPRKSDSPLPPEATT